jgi:hypothetical protein
VCPSGRDSAAGVRNLREANTADRDLGFHVTSINRLDYVAQTSICKVTHSSPKLLGVELHERPSGMLGH